MANSVFPVYAKLIKFSEKPQIAPVRRTEMERGVAKQVRLGARRSTVYACSYVLSVANYSSWKTWYNAHMHEFFDWADPWTGLAIEGRIVDGQYSASAMSSTCTHVNIQLNIEVYE